MKKFLGLGITLACILFFVFLIAAHTMTAYRPHKSNKVKFKTNYKIDLKPDHYLIKDHNKVIHKVPFGELENWIINDNI